MRPENLRGNLASNPNRPLWDLANFQTSKGLLVWGIKDGVGNPDAYFQQVEILMQCTFMIGGLETYPHFQQPRRGLPYPGNACIMIWF